MKCARGVVSHLWLQSFSDVRDGGSMLMICQTNYFFFNFVFFAMFQVNTWILVYILLFYIWFYIWCPPWGLHCKIKSRNFHSRPTFALVLCSLAHPGLLLFCSHKLQIEQRNAPIARTFERNAHLRAILQEALLLLCNSQGWQTEFAQSYSCTQFYITSEHITRAVYNSSRAFHWTDQISVQWERTLGQLWGTPWPNENSRGMRGRVPVP